MRDRRGGQTIDPRKIATYGFVAAMVAAPFLALLFDPNAGLAVMTAALAATVYLALDAARRVDPSVRPRLLAAGSVTAVLALACLGLLLARVL